MFGCLLIPLVHFVAFPASPFIGGYFGIKYAQVPRESYAAKCLLFGALLGSLFLILASLAAALAVTLSDLGQRFLVIIWIGVGVLTLYTGSMSALGAMFSVLRSGGQSNEPAEAAAE
jgi:MFS family permease